MTVRNGRHDDACHALGDRAVRKPAPRSTGGWPDPSPGAGEILIRVSVCGVCHTELDEIEGRMPPPRLPIILGHQVVGRVEALGEGAAGFRLGDRVGVAWIFSACGDCDFCRRGEENLCDHSGRPGATPTAAMPS